MPGSLDGAAAAAEGTGGALAGGGAYLGAAAVVCDRVCAAGAEVVREGAGRERD